MINNKLFCMMALLAVVGPLIGIINLNIGFLIFTISGLTGIFVMLLQFIYELWTE